MVEKCQKIAKMATLNVVFEQLTNGIGLQLYSAKMAWSSSLVSFKKMPKIAEKCQNGNIRIFLRGRGWKGKTTLFYLNYKKTV